MQSLQRDVMAETACSAMLAEIGISSISAPARTTQGPPDREVRLQLSDGFTRQTWGRDGEVWTETRDIIALNESEIVRIAILNDTPATRVVSLGDGRPMLRLRSGEARALDLLVDSRMTFEIAVVGQPALSRPVKVRPQERAEAA
jgi:hypothetical protein